MNCLMSVGHKPPVCLDNANTLELNPASPVDGSMEPFTKSSSASFLITGQ